MPLLKFQPSYYSGDEIEKNVGGGAYDYIKYRGRRGAYTVLVGNPERQRSLEDSSVDRRIILRWIFGMWDGGMDWTYLAQYTNRWRTHVNAIMNLRVP